MFWQGCGEKGTHTHFWYILYAKSTTSEKLRFNQNDFTSWYLFQELKKKKKNKSCTPMFIVVLFIITKIWKPIYSKTEDKKKKPPREIDTQWIITQF